MSQVEQERLYKHYLFISKNGKDDTQRTNAKGYAKEILESYPQFEIKEVEKVVEEIEEIKEKEKVVEEIEEIKEEEKPKKEKKKNGK